MSAHAWQIAIALGGAQREGRGWRCQCLVHGSCSLGLLNGAWVVMRADAVAIETTTGARQTWRRKPTETGQVLAWELADAERR